jgi:hypothetical protein
VADLFTETTQKSLLQEFRQLRGPEDVVVTGLVSRDLAKAIEEEMGLDEHEDPAHVVEVLTAKKEAGNALLRADNSSAAYPIWAEVGIDIGRMMGGSSWTALAKRGGHAFINNVAHLKFSAGLNMALVGINESVAMIKSGSSTADNLRLQRQWVQIGLRSTSVCLDIGYWKAGNAWRPSHVLLAKLMYRNTVSVRLWGDDMLAGQALQLIFEAAELIPNDPAILKEREMIQKWLVGGDRS